MPTKRFTGAAAVTRSGVSAGTIDSSNGKANVTPAPRRNVRRGMCFFVINIVSILLIVLILHLLHASASRLSARRTFVRFHLI